LFEKKVVFILPIYNKTLLTVILCLIFIGQSMASSVMFYKMDMTMMKAAGQHVHMSNMPASPMLDHAMTDNTMTEDCCSTECQCLVTGCSSVFAFSKVFVTNVIIDSFDKIFPNKFLISQQVLPPLYRPPIAS